MRSKKKSGQRPMQEIVNIIFLNVEKNFQLFDDLSQHYQMSKDIKLWQVDTSIEAEQIIASEGNGILIFKVASKEHLTSSIETLKKNKVLNKRGLFRCACLMDNDNPKIRKILGKYGCSDVLETNVKLKTVTFKTYFWTRGIKSAITRFQKSEPDKKSISSKEEEAKNIELKGDFQFIDPLVLHSDMWILKSQQDCKRIIKRYLIKLMGPSSHVGSWHELESQPGDKCSSWRWEFHNEMGDQFLMDDGAWVFYGSKPEFDWKTHLWNFSGETPHLYFYREDKQVFSKLKFSNRQVVVAGNSQYALAKKELIIETADPKFQFSAEKQADEEKKNFEDKDSDVLNPNLKGKGKTDVIDDENLEGQFEADDINLDPLRGKISDSENGNTGPLEGKNQTDHLDYGPMSSKKNKNLEERDPFEKDMLREANSNERSPDHYGGKSETDYINCDPLEGKSKSEYEHEGGHYGGKSNTDYINCDPLEGKNNSEYEHDTDPLAGRGDTDHLRHDPLGAKVKPDDREDGPLSGKTETDRLRRDPLGSKVKPEEHGNGNPLTGDGDTDKLSHGPLSGRLNKNNDEQRERSGIAPLEAHRANLNETDEEGGAIDELGDGFDPDALQGIDDPESARAESQPKLNPLAANFKKEKDPIAPQKPNGEPEGQLGKVNPLRKMPSRNVIETSIEEALQDGLTKGAKNLAQSQGSTEDLSYIEKDPEVSTESGVVKISLKQISEQGEELNHICQFEDLFEKELVVLSPKGNLSIEMEVKVHLVLEYSGKSVKIDSKAQVFEVEEYDDLKDYACLNLLAIEDSEIEDFLELYEKRQENIDVFMLSAKGY